MTKEPQHETIVMRKIGDGVAYRDADGNEVITLPPKGKEPAITSAAEKGKPPCALSAEQWDNLAIKLNIPITLQLKFQNDPEQQIGYFRAPAKVLTNICTDESKLAR